MITARKFFIILFIFIGNVCWIDASVIQQMKEPKWDGLTFDYSKENLSYLKSLPKPEKIITTKQLDQLTNNVTYLINTTKLSDVDQTIIPPYLANAQKDFAWLSYLITGELAGDLGPITLWTLQLFIPNAELATVHENNFDAYSSSLAAIVLKKVALRLSEERNQIVNYPIKRGGDLWSHTSPGYTGLNFGSLKTWYLASSDEYLVEKPQKEHRFWKKECASIIQEQKQLDGDKVQAVFKWAGLTAINANSWEKILTDYLNERKISIIPQLYIRSLFLSALADSNAVAFNSKYTYWIKRPSQMDAEVNPLINIPNHPSYPSAHSTISSTAATLLKIIFPEDKDKWNNLAEESGMSRIWGGIHYPADHSAGLKLGEQVGNTCLDRNIRN